MLVIRQQQRAVMRAAALRDRLLAHIAEQFPEDCEVLGGAVVRRTVDLGIARAGAHGFQHGDEIRKYIKLMFVLGCGFDEDPLFPWAGRILDDRCLPGPRIRMHGLYTTAAAFLARTAGRAGERYRAALVRVRRTPFEEMVRPRGDGTAATIQAELLRIYPQQYRELSEASFDRVVSHGEAAAAAYGLSTPEGLLVYVAIMFMVGSHFDRDPLHPWATAVLHDRRPPLAKARALHQAAMDRLDLYRFVSAARREAAG